MPLARAGDVPRLQPKVPGASLAPARPRLARERVPLLAQEPVRRLAREPVRRLAREPVRLLAREPVRRFRAKRVLRVRSTLRAPKARRGTPFLAVRPLGLPFGWALRRVARAWVHRAAHLHSSWG